MVLAALHQSSSTKKQRPTFFQISFLTSQSYLVPRLQLFVVLGGKFLEGCSIIYSILVGQHALCFKALVITASESKATCSGMRTGAAAFKRQKTGRKPVVEKISSLLKNERLVVFKKKAEKQKERAPSYKSRRADVHLLPPPLISYS